MLSSVSGGGYKFCTAECARASHVEPERTLEPYEVRGQCHGCGYDLSFSGCTLDVDLLAEKGDDNLCMILKHGGLKLSA